MDFLFTQAGGWELDFEIAFGAYYSGRALAYVADYNDRPCQDCIYRILHILPTNMAIRRYDL